MRLLDRYLLRELIVPFSYCLCGFFIFWITFDLCNELTVFQKHRMTPLDVGAYYLAKSPELLVFVLPVAFLLALLYALTNHARHQELVAMRSAGISLARLSLPYFVVGLLLSLAILALNELWIPDSLEVSERIKDRHIAQATDNTDRQWDRTVGFINQLGQRQWVIQAYNPFTLQMVQPQIIWTRPDGTRHEISAESAFHRNGAWIFTNVQELVFPPSPAALPLRRTYETHIFPEFSEAPDQINRQMKISRMRGSLKRANRTQLSIRQILEYKQWNPDQARQDAIILDTKLYGRMAAPWTCLVVVLIALPSGASSRRRNVFVGVASSIVICFAYFVLLQLGLVLGTGGHLHPILAAWAPNLIFAAAGLFLTWRAR